MNAFTTVLSDALTCPFVDHSSGRADAETLKPYTQTARLLALLSTDAAAEGAITGGGWGPFLEAAAASDDCLLGSDGARALLNCRSASAAARGALPLLTTAAGEGCAPFVQLTRCAAPFPHRCHQPWQGGLWRLGHPLQDRHFVAQLVCQLLLSTGRIELAFPLPCLQGLSG